MKQNREVTGEQADVGRCQREGLVAQPVDELVHGILKLPLQALLDFRLLRRVRGVCKVTVPPRR